jgi:hypothetical protein
MIRHAVLITGLMMLALSVHAQDLTLQGVTTGNFRFKDLGGQAYGQTYIDAFSYTNSSVTVSLDSPGLKYLAGNLTATGLKPNFCYQIKIVGNPSKGATTPEQIAAADDATNERIGRQGRWWRVTPNTGNSLDADYDAHKDDPTYIYEGYLVFWNFVTDANGSANLRFDGNSVYHVTWRTDQRAPAPNDGPDFNVPINATAGNPAYDVSAAARNYTLYGEHEPTRALPGALEMTEGHYRCRLVLHEESFHDSGALAGSWALAMTAPIEFDMPFGSGNPNPQPPVSALPLTLTSLRANLNFAVSGRDRASVAGSLQLAVGRTLANLETQHAIMGVTRSLTLNKRGRARSFDGGLDLRAARDGSGKAVFKAKVSRAAFIWTTGAAVPVTMKLGADDYAGLVTPEIRSNPTSSRLFYRSK